MDKQRGTQKQIAKRYDDRVESRNTRTPWRRTRAWLTLLAVVGGIGAIYFTQKKAPGEFFNTGPLSRHHSHLEEGCAACHRPEPLSNERGGTRFFEVVNDRAANGAPSFERIDRACETCHQQHAFHEPNVAENRSCSACHTEHQGPGPIHPVASVDCAACHNNAAVMQTAASLGKQLPRDRFHPNPKVVDPRAVTPPVARPPEGYTATFASFSENHPAFQLHRENLRERDVLRFNHARHLNDSDIPPTRAGTKLDCTYCHKPEPSGRYMQRVSFEASCRECHSLQFDTRNHDFQLPHGDAPLVRTFLRTLPAQYAELARKRGLTGDERINEFARQQVRQLLSEFRSAEELERSVFFTTDPYKGSEKLNPGRRANYTGCAFCHEVKQAQGGAFPTAEITKPVTIDRWMPHAHFDHAKHATVSECRGCHVAAQGSRLTSDVLMPTKDSCVTCHSASGIARKTSDCTSCHVYHGFDQQQPPPPITTASSVKQMLLGHSQKGQTPGPPWPR